MRELKFNEHVEGLQTQFADIEQLVENCRYNNCEHKTESGCAILTALEDGSLEELRWKIYKKIVGEIKYGLRKHNKWMLAEDRKVWKKRALDARQKNKGWQ